MPLLVRPYQEKDYDNLVALYKNSETYGGQFDENRDSKERLRKRIENDPDAILVAKENEEIVGSVSLIEDGRVAWLFRFCVIPNSNENDIARALFEKAKKVLSEKGHHQVLVYSPAGNEELNGRYKKLGFSRGNDYTCFWENI